MTADFKAKMILCLYGASMVIAGHYGSAIALLIGIGTLAAYWIIKEITS